MRRCSPPELPLRCIRLLTEPGDLVMDCFMGSGTTAVAAIQTEREFLGIELLPEYVETAKPKVDRMGGGPEMADSHQVMLGAQREKKRY